MIDGTEEPEWEKIPLLDAFFLIKDLKDVKWYENGRLIVHFPNGAIKYYEIV